MVDSKLFLYQSTGVGNISELGVMFDVLKLVFKNSASDAYFKLLFSLNVYFIQKHVCLNFTEESLNCRVWYGSSAVFCLSDFLMIFCVTF